MERLSDSELDIMRALWQCNKPMRAGDIVRALNGTRSWKTQTAHVLLGRLCEKGFVTADRSGYYHTFIAKISENEYLSAQSESMAKRAGSSLKNMVASLIDADGVSESDIMELAEMLEKKRREIEAKHREDGQ